MLKRIPNRIMLAAALLLAGACSGGEELGPSNEVNQSALPLHGYGYIATSGTNACTTDHQSQAAIAQNVGKVVSGTEEYTDCLRMRCWNGGASCEEMYWPCSSDDTKTVEAYVQTARAGNDVQLDCAWLDPTFAAITSSSNEHTWGYSGPEIFTLNRTYLDSLATSDTRVMSTRLAGTLWHEAYHVHGYQHGDGTDHLKARADCGYLDSSAYNNRMNSAPYMQNNCMATSALTAQNSIVPAGDNIVRHFQWRYLGAEPMLNAEVVGIYAAMGGGDYTRDTLVQRVLGMPRTNVEQVPSGGDAVTDGVVAAGRTNISGLGAVVMLAGIDQNSGNDYWRYRLLSGCTSTYCATSSPPMAFSSSAGFLLSTGIAMGDMTGDGTPSEFVLSGIHNVNGVSDAWRFVVLSDCNANGVCSFTPEQVVNSGLGDDMRYGGVALGQLDSNSLLEMALLGVLRYPGAPDKWALAIGKNCSRVTGACSWATPIEIDAGGASDLVGGGVAITDVDGDGTNEVFITATDAATGEWRYRIGRSCGTSCIFSPVRTLTSGGAAVTGGSVSTGRFVSVNSVKNIVVSANDAWSTNDDYWRYRVAESCNAVTGRCRWGGVRTELSHGANMSGGQTIAADLNGDSRSELVFAGSDVNPSADYWRYRLQNLGSASTASTFLWEPGGEPNNSIEEASPIQTLPFDWLSPYSLNQVPFGRMHIESPSDVDYYRIDLTAASTLTITVNFRHARGDLDLLLLDTTGAELRRSDGTTNSESITHAVGAGTFFVQVYGYAGATGTYGLRILKS